MVPLQRLRFTFSSLKRHIVFSCLIIYTAHWCLVWLIKSEHSIHQFISCYSTRSTCHRIKKNRCTAPPVARSTAPPVAVCICLHSVGSTHMIKEEEVPQPGGWVRAPIHAP